MRSRVSFLTSGLLRSARDTVAWETPAMSAMSRDVGFSTFIRRTDAAALGLVKCCITISARRSGGRVLFWAPVIVPKGAADRPARVSGRHCDAPKSVDGG